MAQYNNQQNQKKLNSKPLSVDERRDANAIPSPAAFNAEGIQPTATELFYSKARLENAILVTAQSICPDFYRAEVNCTRYKGEKNFSMTAFVWISANSDHVVDKQLMNNDKVFVHQPIVKYSNELMRFMARYQDSENKGQRLLRLKGEPGVRAVSVDLGKIIGEIFDADNKLYKETYPEVKHVKNCFVYPEPVWDHEDHFIGFMIRKAEETPNSHKPKSSGAYYVDD